MKKISVKLAFCFVIMAVAMFLLLNVFGIRMLKRRLIDSKSAVLSSEATLVADEYVTSYYDAESTLKEMLRQLKVVDRFLDARIWVVNSNTAVVADSRSHLTNGIIYLEALDDTFLDYDRIENVYFEGVFQEPMLSIIEPIPYNYSIRGYVCIHVPMSDINREALSYLDFINISYLLFLIVLALVFVFIFWITVVPIQRIRKAAMEYASGNFDYHMKIRSHDEYRDLAATMEYTFGELKNMDDYQKKFIANISHDFRSPLTSIKGYAEAMMDGTIPYENQNKYLGIILFETERLTKLTSNLLDLNRIDTAGMNLEITVFDVNSVIKRTAATFEGRCTEKRITLNLLFSSKEIYVEADMSKIQQVLYNLLDNAIKFSNQGSSINISTEEKASKVFVAVKDFGTGIPKDSLKKIWDRFYKSDTSRGKDKKGTGLGLSIAKEIITAHGENINVVSTENVGTEFVFTLTLAA